MGVVDGAVERIDDPAPGRLRTVGSAALFGEDRVAGALGGESGDDQLLARAIDVGDEIGSGALGADLELRLVALALDRAGLAGQAHGEIEDA